MSERTALVTVNRERTASAEMVAHMPFPVGRDTRPLHPEQSEALLTSSCEWTDSIPSFTFRNIALREGGGTYQQLKHVAEREFLSGSFGGGTFPTCQFADFLETGYRSGLLTKNVVSPNGDIQSPDRITLYEISPHAQELLAQHIPAAVEARAESVPTPSAADTAQLQEHLAPVLEYIRERGPSVRDSMLESLTSSVSNDEVQDAWDRLEDLIDQGIAQGLLTQEENKLGAYVVSLVP